jgi:insertion element IS1 protein InsB
VEAAEIDEMWSFVGSKVQQRWLWHAIDHLSGVVLAYAFGSRADTVFVELNEVTQAVWPRAFLYRWCRSL